MEKIITLTLNPAIDKSTTVKSIAPDKKLRCSAAKYEPGGGGVNVSRALLRLDVPSTAIYLAGGHSGKFYRDLLDEEGVQSAVVEIAGRTRENMIVVDESSNLQYRYGFPGPEIQESEWQQCLQMIEQNKEVEYVVASGSVPAGVPEDFFNRLAMLCKKIDAKLIVDTSGEPLKHAVEEGVYLLKPNLGELSMLQGVEELHQDDAVDAAKEIIKNGGCQVMIISMGASGAMLVTKDECFSSPSVSVKKKSTVGAGDSMVAGTVKALSLGWQWMDVLQYGIATGTATTMNPGTELFKKTDVERLYKQLKERRH
ncbi:1-phosphofructokinase family hexose kinase [Aridibaculum aurantiacum]|uniref:1-phosphofructokinase family hexose kinase n=1 Tax=Aridibaculum aurantiacum TaxID=2810307 RepID=UPI001A975DD1|nr:1-phosphofructokinase family hexose kinase [Aridibaculum aurantiacum]